MSKFTKEYLDHTAALLQSIIIADSGKQNINIEFDADIESQTLYQNCRSLYQQFCHGPEVEVDEVDARSSVWQNSDSSHSDMDFVLEENEPHQSAVTCSRDMQLFLSFYLLLDSQQAMYFQSMYAISRMLSFVSLSSEHTENFLSELAHSFKSKTTVSQVFQQLLSGPSLLESVIPASCNVPMLTAPSLAKWLMPASGLESAVKHCITFCQNHSDFFEVTREQKRIIEALESLKLKPNDTIKYVYDVHYNSIPIEDIYTIAALPPQVFERVPGASLNVLWGFTLLNTELELTPEVVQKVQGFFDTLWVLLKKQFQNNITAARQRFNDIVLTYKDKIIGGLSFSSSLDFILYDAFSVEIIFSDLNTEDVIYQNLVQDYGHNKAFLCYAIIEMLQLKRMQSNITYDMVKAAMEKHDSQKNFGSFVSSFIHNSSNIIQVILNIFCPENHRKQFIQNQNAYNNASSEEDKSSVLKNFLSVFTPVQFSGSYLSILSYLSTNDLILNKVLQQAFIDTVNWYSELKYQNQSNNVFLLGADYDKREPQVIAQQLKSLCALSPYYYAIMLRNYSLYLEFRGMEAILLRAIDNHSGLEALTLTKLLTLKLHSVSETQQTTLAVICNTSVEQLTQMMKKHEQHGDISNEIQALSLPQTYKDTMLYINQQQHCLQLSAVGSEFLQNTFSEQRYLPDRRFLQLILMLHPRALMLQEDYSKFIQTYDRVQITQIIEGHHSGKDVSAKIKALFEANPANTNSAMEVMLTISKKLRWTARNNVLLMDPILHKLPLEVQGSFVGSLKETRSYKELLTNIASLRPDLIIAFAIDGRIEFYNSEGEIRHDAFTDRREIFLTLCVDSNFALSYTTETIDKISKMVKSAQFVNCDALIQGTPRSQDHNVVAGALDSSSNMATVADFDTNAAILGIPVFYESIPLGIKGRIIVLETDGALREYQDRVTILRRNLQQGTTSCSDLALTHAVTLKTLGKFPFLLKVGNHVVAAFTAEEEVGEEIFDQLNAITINENSYLSNRYYEVITGLAKPGVIQESSVYVWLQAELEILKGASATWDFTLLRPYIHNVLETLKELDVSTSDLYHYMNTVQAVLISLLEYSEHHSSNIGSFYPNPGYGPDDPGFYGGGAFKGTEFYDSEITNGTFDNTTMGFGIFEYNT